MTPTASNTPRWTALRPIAQAGLVAGVLDLLAAIAVNAARNIEPLSVLQSIASGLLGRAAYSGGLATAALGTALHFAIMFVIAAVFLAASRRLPFLARHWFASGPLYGVAVYFVMNLVVLPLSAFPHEVMLAPARVATGLLIHAILVGLPIAWIAGLDAGQSLRR